MLQRIQTVYLFVASVLTFCFFVIPYVAIGDGSMVYNVTVCYLSPAASGIKATTMLPLAMVTLCAAVLCLISIFLFGNRTRQMKIVRLNVMLQVVVLLGMAAYCYGLQRAMGEAGTFSFKFAFAIPIVNVILLILAHKGIKADDDLVKSVDRLR